MVSLRARARLNRNRVYTDSEPEVVTRKGRVMTGGRYGVCSDAAMIGFIKRQI